MNSIWHYLGYTVEVKTQVEADEKTLVARNNLLKQVKNNNIKLRPLPTRCYSGPQKKIVYYKKKKQLNIL
jgi:hypothetical protein